MRQIQAMSMGVHEIAGHEIERMGAGRDAAAPRTAGGRPSQVVADLLKTAKARAAAGFPPSSNTGGKSPGKTRKGPVSKGASK
jgi:hypothetical protein